MAGKIITITQQKGGSGKTTLAAHLAASYQIQFKHSVAVLDTDPQGSLGRWLMIRHQNRSEADITLKTASAWGARYEAKQLAENHDLVIIDMPPKSGGDGMPSIEVADLVLVPVAASPVDLWATEPTLDQIRQANKPFRIILNRYNPRNKLTEKIKEALKDLDVKATKTALGHRVLYASSMGEGRTAGEAKPSSPAALEINALTNEVKKLRPMRSKNCSRKLENLPIFNCVQIVQRDPLLHNRNNRNCCTVYPDTLSVNHI